MALNLKGYEITRFLGNKCRAMEIEVFMHLRFYHLTITRRPALFILCLLLFTLTMIPNNVIINTKINQCTSIRS